MIVTPQDNLQQKFDAAQPGETIALRGGEYRQRRVWCGTGHLIIKAHENEPVTWYGGKSDADLALHLIGGDDWVIRDIDFVGGIILGENKVNGVKVLRCKLRDANTGGIRCYNADNVIVREGYFARLKSGTPGIDRHGLSVDFQGENIKVFDSEFVDIGGDGIHLGALGDNIGNVTIDGNVFYLTQDNVPEGENAIDVKATKGATLITNNVIHGYKKQGDTELSAIVCHWRYENGPRAKNVTIRDNLFYDNSRAITLAECADISVIDNTLWKNKIGLLAYSVNGLRLVGNDFRQNIENVREYTDKPNTWKQRQYNLIWDD